MRNTCLYASIFLILVLSNPPANAAAGAPKAAAKPAASAGADQEIEQKILAKLAKSKLAADHFTVSVSHGVATIEGVTDVPQHKGVMTRMAKASGATAVRNNVRLSAVGKAKTTEAFAGARSRSPGAAARTGTSAPEPSSADSPQLPHAKVLPQKSSR